MIRGGKMGLFDRFKKRVREVAEETDEEELTAPEDSQEARDAIKEANIVDEIDNDDHKTFKDPGYYWHGKIPQTVILDGKGNVLLDEEGQVSFDKINEAITKGTGLKKPDFDLTVKSFNEYNSEPSKDGYNKPRGS